MKSRKKILVLATTLILQGLLLSQSASAVGLQSKTMVQLKSQSGSQSMATIQSQAKAQVKTKYKSDALDELLEDNLFKRKKAPLPPTEDSLVDIALKAKVNEKELLGEQQQAVQNLPAVLTQQQLTLAQGQVYSQQQQLKDDQLIQQHLQNFQTGQKEMGSNILYSALMNDLDVSSPAIPAYTPPGMPPQGNSNELYGTQLAPASPWALGVAQASPSENTQALAQLPAQDTALNDQSLTEISAEAYVRGATKYDEQAESLINEDEQQQKSSVQYKQLVQLAQQSQQQEQQEMEDMIGSALGSMKSANKQKVDVTSQIKLQNDLEYVAAFGV